MTRAIVPSGAAGSAWANRPNALDGPNQTVSTNTPAAGTGWLALSFEGMSLFEPSDDIVGFQVLLKAGTHLTGVFPLPPTTTSNLDVAFSLDGGATVEGEVKRVHVDRATDQGYLTVPAAVNDLFGIAKALKGSDINSPGFRLLVRRSTGANETPDSDRLVDHAYVLVHHNPNGASLNDMPIRPTVHQRVLLGKEVTPGTAVACPIRAKSFNLDLSGDPNVRERRQAGMKLPAGFDVMTESASAGISGVPCYRELGYLFSSVFAKPATQLITGTAYRHIFRMNPFGADDPQFFTVEKGDDNIAERMAYMQVVELALSLAAQEATVNGRALGAAIEGGRTITAGVNEVQTLTITGTPTGGNYRLSFAGAETADLAHNATNAAIQSALNALPTLGANAVAVTGAGPFTVTFSGAGWAGKRQPLLVLSSNTLTGGTTPSVTIASTTKGGYSEMETIPIRPKELDGAGTGLGIYMANTYAGLSAGKVTEAAATGFQIAQRASQRWNLDPSFKSIAGMVDIPTMVQVPLTLMADSNGMALLSDFRNGIGKWLRIECIGPVITGSTRFKMILEMFSSISQGSAFSDQDGVYATEYTFTSQFDTAQGWAARLVLENDVASY